jgi:triosephosphate isomerase (TIM)
VRKTLLAGNWKMFKRNSEMAEFFQAFAKEANLPQDKVDIAFAAPAIMLAQAHAIATPLGIIIAAQNVHAAASGAFTGEISIPMLRDIGLSWTVVGHSERRQYYNETDESVAAKVKACVEEKMTVIACVGESLAEYEQGKTGDVIQSQAWRPFHNI